MTIASTQAQNVACRCSNRDCQCGSPVIEVPADILEAPVAPEPRVAQAHRRTRLPAGWISPDGWIYCSLACYLALIED